MGDILFLAHRVPFPPNRGDKIRSHHLLRALVDLAPVHVGCFGETAEDMAAEIELAQIASSHCLIQRTKPLAVAGAQAIVRGKPVSLTAFESDALRNWVEATLAQNDIETIFVFSGQMGQYVPAEFDGRVLIDLCDVDSEKFGDYARQHGWPRSALDRREQRLLLKEEDRLAARSEATFLVTEAEAGLMRSRLPNSIATRVHSLRNGIDTLSYDPSEIEPHPGVIAHQGPHLVFTGQMDYPPNIAAVERVAASILPAVRYHFPNAQFHVVGRAPVEKLRNLDGQAGVRIWGEVLDVKPFLAAADCVLAPLTIARGVQNKVLEAMSMARPVVLSAEAATGIDASDRVHFAVGNNDGELVENLVALLSDGPRALAMGAAARRYVVGEQGWAAMLTPLSGFLGLAPAESGRDAA